MALRYPLPVTEVTPKPANELRIVPAIRPARVVRFRRGGDLNQVADEILESTNVKVDAAVGAGKSVSLPKTLALRARALVFHVVPSPHLAADLYGYVNKLRNANSADYPEVICRTLGDDTIPRMGLVMLSAAEMVSILIESKGFGQFGKCILFLDEAHESDAYTHVLRNLSLAMGVSHLVQASATFSQGEYQRSETPSECIRAEYPEEETPETWNLRDRHKPWFRIQNSNTLVFTDSNAQANKIMDNYANNGYLTFRLKASMAMDEFQEAMAAMRDVSKGLVALVADSSFRSGFTFDVSVIIDTGRVIFMDGRPGEAAKCSRDVYEFEVEQAAGRGGRLRNNPCKYYRPDRPCRNFITELEGVEAEAAAYLYRLLGYQPDGPLADRMLAKRELPDNRNLFSMFNGPYPLTYYVVHNSRPTSPVNASVIPVGARDIPSGAQRFEAQKDAAVVVLPVSSVSSSSVSRRSTLSENSADVLVDALSSVEISGGIGDAKFDSPTPQKLTEVQSADRKPADFVRPGPSDVQPSSDRQPRTVDSEQWAQIVTDVMEGGAQQVSEEKFYFSPTLRDGDGKGYCMYFPDGLKSILEFSQDRYRATTLSGMSISTRTYALALSLDRYNLLNVEIAALRDVLINVADGLRDHMDDPFVHACFTEEISLVGKLEIERRALFQSVLFFAGTDFPLKPFKGLRDTYDKRFRYHRERFQELTSSMERSSSEDYVRRLESSLSQNGSPHTKRKLVERVDMPWWTGIDTVRITRRRDGSAQRATAYPTSFMRTITGVKRVTRSDDRRRVEHLGGKVVTTSWKK